MGLHCWLDLTTFLFTQPDWTLLREGVLLQLAWVVVAGSCAWARVHAADVMA